MTEIYKIVNDINQKIYIGQTTRGLSKRFKEHCNERLRERAKNRSLYLDMNTYGIDHFHIELIEQVEDAQANDREQYQIYTLNSFKEGYNDTLGGEGTQIYDYKAILERLKQYPYPAEVAKEFNCSKYTVRNIAHKNNIPVKSQQIEKFKEKSKQVAQYDKEKNLLNIFNSTADAARFLHEEKIVKNLNSGVRSHISAVANGKRKSAYGYIWKYI